MTDNPYILCVIPARLNATRFPGKPLALINGKPMIQRTYEAACRAACLSKVVVATDNEEIAEVVRAVGGEDAAMMTGSHHTNGTERVLEVVEHYRKEKEIFMVVNLQGDQPFIEPTMINALVAPYLVQESPPPYSISTLGCPLDWETDYTNPNSVKVVCDQTDKALYFSRAPIPRLSGEVDKAALPVYHHIGVYAFRHDVLDKLSELKPTPLELSESLEQLRFLESGRELLVCRIEKKIVEINTPEDLEKAQKFFDKGK